MPEAQLRFFPEPRPLLERFGAEFFLAIPRAPGVYVMTGERDRVLYIGKASNLRQRLASYKYLRGSRKSRRLACMVRSITWETCDDPPAASLRENQLLRLHKPLFNVLNTRSEHYPFIGLRYYPRAVHLRLTKSPDRHSGETLFGAFKGLPFVRDAFRSLARMLWAAEFRPESIFSFPSALVTSDSLANWTTRLECYDELRDFLHGVDDRLLGRLSAAVPEAVSLFQRSFHSRDLDLLREFFQRGPSRNARLRERFGLDVPIIPQTELDDLLALAHELRGHPARCLSGDARFAQLFFQ